MNKIYAVIAAIMMIVAIPIGFAASDADADTGVTGTYSVYAFNGSAWSSDIVSAYDAAQAVQASDMWATGDSMVAKYTEGDWVTYNYTTYGNITTFMGQTNSDARQWNVFIINTDGGIVAATDCLGSYKCFSDYDQAHRTANIILYYGSSSTPAQIVAAQYNAYSDKVTESSITNVSDSEAFKVSFNLQITYPGVNASISGSVYDVNGNLVSDASLKASTVTVVGYGSDCYLALKDAVGSANFTGEDTVPDWNTIRTDGWAICSVSEPSRPLELTPPLTGPTTSTHTGASMTVPGCLPISSLEHTAPLMPTAHFAVTLSG